MSQPAARVPSHIGRFVVESVLGTGGMGAVYKATDPTLKRTVAVKTVRPDISDPVYLQRLVGEAQACARLQHPHIVTVYEAGEIDGGVYVVMEYLEGEDLAQALWRGELTFEARVRILIQILEALEHAHANGVVHRDIKPPNIRVLPNGSIKIVDFGLARMAQVDGRTVTGTIVGTLHYASPEQLRGEKVDGRSDIYSTGTMAYEMCSGRRPFDGETISTIIIKVIQDPIPPMEAQWSRTFPEIEKIVAKAMAKDAADRYQTAAEMRSALTSFLEAARERIAASGANATVVVQQPSITAHTVPKFDSAATMLNASPAPMPTATVSSAGARHAQPVPPPSRPWLIPAAALVALSVLGFSGYMLMPGGEPVSDGTVTATSAPPATSTPESPVSPVSASPAPTLPAGTPNPSAATSAKRDASAPPPNKPESTNVAPVTAAGAANAIATPPPAPVASTMFYAATGSSDSPNTGLRYRVTQQTRSGAEADVDHTTSIFRTGDKVRLSFESNVDGYLYVVQQGSSGRWSVLFPSPDINFGRNSVRKSEEYKVPDDGWFEFDGNPGVENLFVFFSREPMQTLPGFSKPVTKPETLTASAVTELQNTIASRDLTFSRDPKASVKGGNLIQANYVVNRSELGKAVSASFALRHEP